MESSPRDAEPGSEGESPSQDSAADDRELASECSVESQPESMPASDLFSLFDEGVEKHGGFYRDLFRMELIFNEACTCNDCKSAVAEAIDQSLTLLQTTRTLLLCFADLPADELGCEGLRLISYETLLSDADTPQGRVHMLETHINHGLLELSRLLGKRLLAKTVRKRLQSLAETLEQNILQPLDDVITAASAVVFVAFGSCAEVPFGAILWHGRPLMLQLPTSYATSVADLARMATLVPDLEHCDLIVASATHSPAVGGSLPCVPLAGVEAAMLQNKLSRNSEQRTADADGQHGNKKLTCLAHATCDELMSCLGNCDIADTLKDHIRYGFQPELALFHYSGHVAEGAFEDSSDAWPQEALAKQLCLTDGEYDLGGVLDTAKNYTSLIYISACCGDELACHQSRHSKTGCPGHGGNGAAVVCCTWPLSDIAGLVLCQDFYTALINLVKDTGGSKHQASNENGVAEGSTAECDGKYGLSHSHRLAGKRGGFGTAVVVLATSRFRGRASCPRSGGAARSQPVVADFTGRGIGRRARPRRGAGKARRLQP